MTDPQARFLDYLDGRIGEAEFAELRAWMIADPANAVELAKLSLLETQLRETLLFDELLSADSEPPEDAAVAVAPPPGRLRRVFEFFSRPTPLSLAAAALVIGLLITAMAFMAPPFYRAITRTRQGGGDASPLIVARLTALNDAVWADGQVGAHRGAHLQAGHRIGLVAGLVELTYGEGAKVVLEGPCEYVVKGHGAGRLERGKLASQVPPAAIGFKITTPVATIEDLGTAFGVEVPSKQVAEVHVFAGKVAVQRKNVEEKASVVAAGQSVRVTARAAGLEYDKSDPKRFARSVHPDIEPLDPSTVAGLVGWYDAQALSDASGTPVGRWRDKTGGTNQTADDLLHVTAAHAHFADATGVAPTLQTVSLNGRAYRVVRFADHDVDGEFDLLQARGLVAEGDSSRTMIFVLRGGADSDWSRPGGFGSVLVDFNGAPPGGPGPGKENWNLGADGNGSSRFDGAFIRGYAPGLSRGRFVIRTAVMNSAASFDEFVAMLQEEFNERQVLANGAPSQPLNSIKGDFHVGDVYEGQRGGRRGDSQFDILEVLVFDTALAPADRRGIHVFLVEKYSNPASRASEPTQPAP